MTTPIDIARAVFPGISNEDADGLIWMRTGFPAFWHTDNPAREMYKSLDSFRRAERNGIVLCLFCCNKTESGEPECKRCGDVLRRARLEPRA